MEQLFPEENLDFLRRRLELLICISETGRPFYDQFLSVCLFVCAPKIQEVFDH